MKKIPLLVLLLIICLFATACGNDYSGAENSKTVGTEADDTSEDAVQSKPNKKDSEATASVVSCKHVADGARKVLFSGLEDDYAIPSDMEELYECVDEPLDLRVDDIPIVVGITTLNDLSNVFKFMDVDEYLNTENTYVLGDSFEHECKKLCLNGSDGNEVAAYFKVNAATHTDISKSGDAVITDIRFNIAVLGERISVNDYTFSPESIRTQFNNLFGVFGNSDTRYLYSKNEPCVKLSVSEEEDGEYIHMTLCEDTGDTYYQSLVKKHTSECRQGITNDDIKKPSDFREINIFGERFTIGATVKDWINKDNVYVKSWTGWVNRGTLDGELRLIVYNSDGDKVTLDIYYLASDKLENCIVYEVDIFAGDSAKDNKDIDMLYGLRPKMDINEAEDIMELIRTDIEKEFGTGIRTEKSYKTKTTYTYQFNVNGLHTAKSEDVGVTIVIRYDSTDKLVDFISIIVL